MVTWFQASFQADICAVTEEEILYCEKGSKCEGGKAWLFKGNEETVTGE